MHGIEDQFKFNISFLDSIMDLTPKFRIIEMKVPKQKKNSVKTGVNSLNSASGRTGEANKGYH